MKDELRKNILQKRKDLSKIELMEKSNRIKNRLFEMNDFREAQTMLFYVSYNNEVYTHEMIKECLSNRKKVIVPKSDTTNNTLIISELTDWDDLELGAYNILEPKEQSIIEVDIDLIDLIIVPGVVFDIYGNRIGHGKGYYDRLLKRASNIPSIGLAFEFQIVKKIDAEEHDEKIDVIITEDRTIVCNW